MSFDYRATNLKTGTTFEFDDIDGFLEQGGNNDHKVECLASDNSELFDLLAIDGSTIGIWLEQLNDLEGDDRVIAHYLVEQCGYCVQDDLVDCARDVLMYAGDIEELARERVEDDVRDLPEYVARYIDYEAFGRDLILGGDYAEFEFEGATYYMGAV